MRSYKITAQQRAELMEKFSRHLDDLTMVNSNISFSHNFADVKNKEKVFVTFTMKAYIKMRDLVDRYDSEVGWFGFIDKISDLEYQVTDICVYPQLVTGATVKETNESWDDDMPIEQIKRRHFHGHSHVNMGVGPSGTDMKHRDDQVAMVKEDSFYFFMITNKKCAWSAALFDLANNVIYNTDDILIDVDLGDGEMLTDFVEDAKKMIKTQTSAALKKMMDERAGVKPSTVPPVITTSNCYQGQSAWLPESAKKQTKKKEQPQVELKELPGQQNLFHTWTEEEWENYAATQPEYLDDTLGIVSDSPMVCNEIILASMR